MRVLLKNLLQECGKKAEEVESVEVVGGSSRIPVIKKIIAEVFQKEPKTTMNQDEAAARGYFSRQSFFIRFLDKKYFFNITGF